jgi:hypothetical protein
MAHIIAERPWVASDNEIELRNEFITKILGEAWHSVKLIFA